MDDKFAAGRDFILREGRLLERRLFATCFEGAPATGVVDAVSAFRNDDGGFGHGLEPDVRCPASLPVDVEVAFQALATARAADRGVGAGRLRLFGQGGGRRRGRRRRTARPPRDRVLPEGGALD